MYAYEAWITPLFFSECWRGIGGVQQNGWSPFCNVGSAREIRLRKVLLYRGTSGCGRKSNKFVRQT
jgi:hypothetical protein